MVSFLSRLELRGACLCPYPCSGMGITDMARERDSNAHYDDVGYQFGNVTNLIANGQNATQYTAGCPCCGLDEPGTSSVMKLLGFWVVLVRWAGARAEWSSRTTR